MSGQVVEKGQNVCESITTSGSLSAETPCAREIESSTLSFQIHADSFDSAALLRLD